MRFGKSRGDDSVKKVRESRGYYICVEGPNIDVKKYRKNFVDSIPDSRILKLGFSVKKPLHIGSGNMVLKNGELTYEMQRYGDDILIPGSSIKGAFRAYFELFFSKEYADYIFGNTKKISSVFFSDVVISTKDTKRIRITKTKIQRQFFNEKKGVCYKSYKIYHCKDDERIQRKKPFSVVALEKGSYFESEIVLTGLDDVDVVNLLTVVGANPKVPFYIHIGRGKEQGLGVVKVDVLDGNIKWERASEKLLEEAKSLIDITKCGVES